MYPSSTVDMLNPETDRVDSFSVELQGFDMMAFNDDRSKLFVAFSEHKGGCVFYVMTRDKKGNYVKPIRFEFFPERRGSEKVDIADYDEYGHPSAMKSWVLLNGNGKLYLFDINDC